MSVVCGEPDATDTTPPSVRNPRVVVSGSVRIAAIGVDIPLDEVYRQSGL